jgi:hypothetical protein
VDIPDSLWERLKADPKRLAVLMITLVVVVGVIGAIAVPRLFVSGSGSDGPSGQLPVSGDGDAADEATSGAAVDATGQAGSDPGESGSGDSGPTGDGASGSQVLSPTRVALVAYRLEGGLWVAKEDGTGTKRVVDSTGGTFKLSPDGEYLAIVEQGGLSLVTVVGGARRSFGAAEPTGLVWHPDSSAVYATRITSGGEGASEVWRFPITGTPARVLEAGRPAVASDGTLVAPEIPAFGTTVERGSVWIARESQRAARVVVAGPTRECVAENGVMAYALVGSGSGSGDGQGPEIRVAHYDGTADRLLVGPPTTPRPFAYGHLMLSPNAEYLLFAEVGDDGYSRALIAPVTGGSVRALTVRRDTYPVGWSADGSRAFFVEGNAFQGEQTALMSVRPDGTGRRVIVEGAGL